MTPRSEDIVKWGKMRDIAREDALDATVVALASRLASPHPPDDWLGIAREIFRFVRDGIRYQHHHDRKQELNRVPAILARGYENCTGKTVTAVALLRSLGMDADVKPVWSPAGELSHVQLQVRWPGSARVAGAGPGGWITGELTIRGVELGDDPHATGTNPETEKLPLAGGPAPAYQRPPSPLD